MKNKLDQIDVALSAIGDHPPRPKLSPRMIWLRGMALERQRAARRSLRLTRALSALMFLLVVLAGVALAPTSAITSVVDQAAAAACAVVILGYTALQLLRSAR